MQDPLPRSDLALASNVDISNPWQVALLLEPRGSDLSQQLLAGRTEALEW